MAQQNQPNKNIDQKPNSTQRDERGTDKKSSTDQVRPSTSSSQRPQRDEQDEMDQE